MKKMINITVFDQGQCGAEWPPTNAIVFLQWFTWKIAEIPEEFRANAKVEIEGVSSYGNANAHMSITYCRPETDEEAQAREQKEIALAKAKKDAELRQLAALKAKYGDLQ